MEIFIIIIFINIYHIGGKPEKAAIAYLAGDLLS